VGFKAVAGGLACYETGGFVDDNRIATFHWSFSIIEHNNEIKLPTSPFVYKEEGGSSSPFTFVPSMIFEYRPLPTEGKFLTWEILIACIAQSKSGMSTYRLVNSDPSTPNPNVMSFAWNGYPTSRLVWEVVFHATPTGTGKPDVQKQQNYTWRDIAASTFISPLSGDFQVDNSSASDIQGSAEIAIFNEGVYYSPIWQKVPGKHPANAEYWSQADDFMP